MTAIDRATVFDNATIALRGDKMSGDRYASREFMAREWRHLWPRVWHIAGWASELEGPGDWLAHEIGRQSILVVRQPDGGLKAFHNICTHRGNRLVHGDLGAMSGFTCSYHGWRFGLDGTLGQVRDAGDFPGGDPCGKRNLKEVRCEQWGGFVWINMDPKAPPVLDFLDPLPDLLAGYRMEEMVRVLHLTVEVECNWKIIQDNFNESYHLPTLHPELATFIDDGLEVTGFELYPSGHNRMRMYGGRPSIRDPNLIDPLAPLDSILDAWALDPEDFRGRAGETRAALQKQKRLLGRERGYTHYDSLSDDQLTDYQHCTLFPNVSLTMSSDGFQLLRPEPHPTDPEKCIFDHWFMVPKTPADLPAETPLGLVPRVPAEHERFRFGERSAGSVADQDLSIAVGQQLGVQSLGYDDAWLARQEHRVRRFHETLNDFIAESEGRNQ
jgi:phenylpropionate dioxygenase-like ring-hydroxylating dioxygenase large terminal subunit